MKTIVLIIVVVVNNMFQRGGGARWEIFINIAIFEFIGIWVFHCTHGWWMEAFETKLLSRFIIF